MRTFSSLGPCGRPLCNFSSGYPDVVTGGRVCLWDNGSCANAHNGHRLALRAVSSDTARTDNVLRCIVGLFDPFVMEDVVNIVKIKFCVFVFGAFLTLAASHSISAEKGSGA